MLKHSFLARLLLALPKVLKLSKWNLLIPVVIVGIVGVIEEVSPLRLLAVLFIISAFWLTECIATVFQHRFVKGSPASKAGGELT